MKYKETEIGKIAHDWQIARLGELCDVKSGKRLPKGHSLTENKTSHRYIRVRDLSDMSIKVNGLLYLQNETHESIAKYIITENDVY